jgi:hypothetical protein
MLVGFAVIVTVATGTTLMVVWAVVVPPAPVAVNVYVVVAAGVTCACPVACTLPTPLSIEIVVALVVFQLRVAELPAAIEVLSELNVAVGIPARGPAPHPTANRSKSTTVSGRTSPATDLNRRNLKRGYESEFSTLDEKQSGAAEVARTLYICALNA